MLTLRVPSFRRAALLVLPLLVAIVIFISLPSAALAQPAQAGGEASLKLPDLAQATFLGGTNGRTLLMWGLAVCALGLLFGLLTYSQLRDLPVHRSMLEISELIYETCKTYLITQGKFLLILELFIGAIIVLYFGLLEHMEAMKVLIILVFSLIGIAGSYGVAWFGIRVNTFANSRTAFASLTGKAFPCNSIPLKAGMSIGMMLISIELVIMLFILLFIPGDYAGPCFIGFAIGESLGAAALRVAGGIFTKIADIGADLMKIVFKIKEDDARNPGVIADCTGDNAGDSVGPSADGFETYGVTGVALITFILLAVSSPLVQVQLLVWIFVMRVMMIVSSGISYFINHAIAKSRYGNVAKMNFEAPLTSLVWLTSIVSIALTYLVSSQMIPELAGDTTLWWKLSSVITCGTLAGAIIPELVKVFTSMNSRHVREVVTASQEGGASLNILAGFVAGNFSAYWLGMAMLALMSIAYWISTFGLATLMIAPAVFAFGLVAFGFLGMGPVTIAVDSYGPGDRQRAVGFRAFDHRNDSRDRRGNTKRLRLQARLREGQGEPRRKRRRREYFQSHRQAGPDWNRGGGRHHHDLFDHRVAYGRFEDGVAVQALYSVSAIPAGAYHRRRGNLLVHGRIHAGRHHRRISRGAVHQGQYPSGKLNQGVRGR